MCQVEPVDELLARRAAGLRTGAGRGSAVDAIVIAFAEGNGGVVLTRVRALGFFPRYAMFPPVGAWRLSARWAVRSRIRRR